VLCITYALHALELEEESRPGTDSKADPVRAIFLILLPLLNGSIKERLVDVAAEHDFVVGKVAVECSQRQLRAHTRVQVSRGHVDAQALLH